MNVTSNKVYIMSYKRARGVHDCLVARSVSAPIGTWDALFLLSLLLITTHIHSLPPPKMLSIILQRATNVSPGVWLVLITLFAAGIAVAIWCLWGSILRLLTRIGHSLGRIFRRTRAEDVENGTELQNL